MHPLTKFAIGTVIYIILGWFVCQPLTEIGRTRPYAKMSENGHQITHLELTNFMDIWYKMTETKYAKNYNIKSLKSSNRYPKGLITWLKLQDWDIDRFFYDEQRIQDLLKHVDLKHQLEDDREIDANSGINLDDIINDLEKTLRSTSFNEEEIALIEINRYEISKLMTDNSTSRKK